MNKVNILIFFVFFFSILFVFRNWFLSPINSAGDLWYFFPSMYENYFLYPYAWYINAGVSGMGSSGIALQNGNMFAAIALSIADILNLSWEFASKFILFSPFIAISLISSAYLVKKLFPKNNFWFFAPIVFTFNTYILMVVGGGQIPTALAYSLMPIIVYLFLTIIEKNFKSKYEILTYLISSSLILGLQVFIDLRIAFISSVAVFLYFITAIMLGKIKHINIVSLLSAFGLVVLSNLYWIIPVLFIGTNPLGELGSAYSSNEIVKFLSFAKIENSIGLLHPYWPENIFGKIGFMKSEFLVLPILAFSSLVFLSKDKIESKYVLYFVLLALVGIFLGKGSSSPGGQIYIWLFEYVPGFQLFRDSFKWFSLVVLSYSVLIPYAVWKIYELIKSKDKLFNSKIFNLSNGFVLLAIVILLFLIKPAILNQLGGSFQYRSLPEQYSQLNEHLSKDSGFYRTLWIPNTMLYGYYSNLHPQISGKDFFEIYDDDLLLDELSSSKSEQLFENSGVKYVIIPEDTEGLIFLEDREYDENIYQKFVTALDDIDWLEKEKEFGKIVVYKTNKYKDHFWIKGRADLEYEFVNPTKYLLNIRGASEGSLLIFSEKYDPGWIAKVDGIEIASTPYNNKFNSFTLPQGSYELEVYYKYQRYVDIGLILSLTTLFAISAILVIILVKQRRK